MPESLSGQLAIEALEAAPLSYVTLMTLIFHFAYKVTSTAVVYPVDSLVPVGVADQPSKVYPVFARVPTVGNVTALPPVVYVSVVALASPEAPFGLYIIV